jgi:hypothetical protein
MSSAEEQGQNGCCQKRDHTEDDDLIFPKNRIRASRVGLYVKITGALGGVARDLIIRVTLQLHHG